MKKYYVNVHLDYVCPIELEAENEEQAHELAAQMSESADINQLECNGIIDICTTDIENID